MTTSSLAPVYDLSTNFSLKEATVSDTASTLNISNTPAATTIAVMIKAAVGLERVRALLGNLPLHINSWYRSPALNEAVGSKPTSQHLKGEAIDFICPAYGSPAEIAKLLVANSDLIRYDQLILEHTWIHISFSIINGSPRNQVLSLITGGHYATGLTDIEGNKL